MKVLRPRLYNIGPETRIGIGLTHAGLMENSILRSRDQVSSSPMDGTGKETIGTVTSPAEYW